MSRTEVLILDQSVSDNRESNVGGRRNCQSQKYQFFYIHTHTSVWIYRL